MRIAPQLTPVTPTKDGVGCGGGGQFNYNKNSDGVKIKQNSKKSACDKNSVDYNNIDGDSIRYGWIENYSKTENI